MTTSSPKASTEATDTRDGYVVPLIGARVPGVFVDLGFWGALAGTAALGIVDPPLAVLIGAGVLIARHRHRP